MSKVQVQTTNVSRFGKTVNIAGQEIVFDQSGKSSVDSEAVHDLSEYDVFLVESNPANGGQEQVIDAEKMSKINEYIEALKLMTYDQLTQLAVDKKISKKEYSQFSTIEALADFLGPKLA